MKLRIADYMISGAKHLLHSRTTEYERAGALVRHAALQAATKCARIGRNTDLQLHRSLKEFLAFFCVLTVSEFALKENRKTDAELRELYTKLVAGICDGPEPEKALVEHQLTVRRIMTYKKSGFDHWFYGYWNADFEGMRVSQAERNEVEARQSASPSGGYGANARLILIIRVSRLDNTQLSVPATAVLAQYQRTVCDEVDEFTKRVRELSRATPA